MLLTAKSFANSSFTSRSSSWDSLQTGSAPLSLASTDFVCPVASPTPLSSVISVEELTSPLVGSDPCGEDLSLGTSLLELDVLILGKSATQFGGEAEPPDWRKVEQTCLELFKRSRDLRVSVALALALTCTKGLGGLRDGLKVVRELLEKQWVPLHPKLDPDDSNDPLQRMNTLAVLAAPIGKDGDPFRFIERLQLVPLTNSRQFGRLAFGALEEARQAAAGNGSTPPGIDPAQVDAAFRDTPTEEVRGGFQHASDSLEQIRAIGRFLNSTVGSAQAPSFSELEKALKAIQRLMQPYVKDAAATSTDGASALPAETGSTPAAAGTGPVASREDVLRVLGQIRTFYAKHEPASPIPLLIRRIERMVPMSFLEILKELAPDSINQVDNIVGPQS